MATINSAETQKRKTAAAARVAQWLERIGTSTSSPLHQRYQPIMDLTRAETIISMSQAESALSQIHVRFPFKLENVVFTNSNLPDYLATHFRASQSRDPRR